MPNEERQYFVLCNDNCKFESMTKEQILAAITQAVESHEITDVDTGFVTKIKETNGNTPLQFWVGTQAQYNALEEPAQNVFYIITDDTTIPDFQNSLETLRTELDTITQYDVGLFSETGENDFYFLYPQIITKLFNGVLYYFEIQAWTAREIQSGELLTVCKAPAAFVPNGLKVATALYEKYLGGEEPLHADIVAYIKENGDVQIETPDVIPANRRIFIQGFYRNLPRGVNGNGDI